MNKDKRIVYMICNDKQIKMTRDVFDYLMTVKHYNKKLKEEIIKLQQENEKLKNFIDNLISQLNHCVLNGTKKLDIVSDYIKQEYEKALNGSDE